MKLSTRNKLFILFILFLVLALSNPSEQKFLKSMATKYGTLHGGMKMTISQLAELGESNKDSYLIYSIYTYEFGNIGVRYFGIAGMTFFIRSYKTLRINENKDVIVFND